MGTRIIFLAIALGLVAAAVWAYHHDEALRKNSAQVNLGDPNEVVTGAAWQPHPRRAVRLADSSPHRLL